MLSHFTKSSQQGLCWFVVIVATGLPRLSVLGSLPSTDEGVFAYFSQIILQACPPDMGYRFRDIDALPNVAILGFDLSVNHLMFLRLVDLIVALVAGLLFYKVIEQQSQSRLGATLIAAVFLF